MNIWLQSRQIIWLQLLTALAAVNAVAAPAPYAVDADTLHLWHLDEAAPPCMDAVAGGTNLTSLNSGATLGAANVSFPGFGFCLNTYDGGADNPAQKDASLSALPLVSGSGDDVALTLADSVTGAFTFEAMVRVDFDPTVSLAARGSGMQIMSGDGDGTLDRVFQWRIYPVGVVSGTSDTNVTRMEFINIRQGVAIQSIGFPLPTNGVNAIASNQWYHVAVTYNGNANTANNLLFYWTPADAAVTAANLIGAATMSNDLSVAACDFTVGNEGRAANGSTENFVGLIDEVRISRLARASNQMLFTTNASSDAARILTGPIPAYLNVLVGQPANFAISVGGTNVAIQWRHAGVPLPGETNAMLTLTSAGLKDAGNYDAVVTNGFPSAVTSSVATLVVTVPEQTPSGPFVSYVPIDDGDPGTSENGYAGSAINSISFAQNNLITIGSQQFISYYRRHATNANHAANNTVAVARRTVGESLWEVFPTSFTSFNINDTHNVISMAIDGDGVIHMSWGMHVNNLLYARSTGSVLGGNPIVMTNLGTAGMTGQENSVTYPKFQTLPDGDVLFLFREGSSGSGDWYLNRYDTVTDTWSPVHTNGSGVQQPLMLGRGDSPDNCFYPDRLTLGPDGMLHMAGVFRYNSDSQAGESGYQTNHRYVYLRSPDGGTTWQRSDGSAITVPVVEAGWFKSLGTNHVPEIVKDLPEGHSIMNESGMTTDRAGRPIIANWWADNAASGDHTRQYHIFFHDGSQWQQRTVSARTNDNPATKYSEAQLGSSRMGRPVVLTDTDDRIIVIYNDNRFPGVTTVFSEPRAKDPNRNKWTRTNLTHENIGDWDATYDEARWKQDGVLHLFYQKLPGMGMSYSSQNNSTPVSVLEWNAASYFDHRPTLKISLTNATDTVLTWNAQPGWFYQIQSGTNLTAWENVAALPGTMGELNYTHTNSIGHFERYWRIEAHEGGFAP